MRSVIVGGGVAGITAAMDLARRNAGEVIVISDEDYPYYYRPQLTEFLAGNLPLSRLVRHPLSWYAEHGIELRIGTRVSSLALDRKAITLDGGDEVTYDKLLLAMGSMPFVPPLRGSEKRGIRTWRTLADTLEMEKAASKCQEIVVIGGGLLGLEAARGLRRVCPSVTVLEYFPRLMPRQLDDEGARLLQDFVESQGINVVVGARCTEFRGSDRVTGVCLDSGLIYPAQAVVVAAGVRSNTSLAREAGIAVDRGIVVDAKMATSAVDVYAAGDVASFKGYTWAIAPIAQAQGRFAAANMAGEETLYDIVAPSTTLKVVGIDVSSVGLVTPEDDEHVEIRELDTEAGTYKKVVLHDGVIVGSIVINDRQLAKVLETAVSKRAPMTADEAQSAIG